MCSAPNTATISEVAISKQSLLLRSIVKDKVCHSGVAISKQSLLLREIVKLKLVFVVASALPSLWLYCCIVGALPNCCLYFFSGLEAKKKSGGFALGEDISRIFLSFAKILSRKNYFVYPLRFGCLLALLFFKVDTNVHLRIDNRSNGKV